MTRSQYEMDSDYKPLEIKKKTLRTWEYGTCNDCNNESHYELKYPRIKRGIIQVCSDCLNKYYKFCL